MKERNIGFKKKKFKWRDYLKEIKKMFFLGINVLKEIVKNRFLKVWFLFLKKLKRIMYFYMIK